MYRKKVINASFFLPLLDIVRIYNTSNFGRYQILGDISTGLLYQHYWYTRLFFYKKTKIFQYKIYPCVFRGSKWSHRKDGTIDILYYYTSIGCQWMGLVTICHFILLTPNWSTFWPEILFFAHPHRSSETQNSVFLNFRHLPPLI